MTATPIAAQPELAARHAADRAPRRSLAPRRTARRPLRVAIAGCGVVGGELVRTLIRDRASLAARRGVDVEIVRVLVRDAALPRPIGLDRALLTTSTDELLAARADVVVEAIGGLDPALRLARETLRRGARFVTANKALVAAHGDELASVARRNGGTLQYDAAVGGGVPVLRILENALGGTAPRAVRGILNGTSNFVLTLLERGASLDDALAEARRRGLAEADATRDLDGRDAAAKIAIIAWTAFGIAPEQVRVRRRGLLPDPERMVRHAARLGGRLRLVAECVLDDDGTLVASVEPAVVDGGGALGRTLFEENHVEIVTGWTAPLVASGPGAGGSPTATAVLSDLLVPVARPGWRARRAAVARAARQAGSHARPRDDARELRWSVAAECDPLALGAALRERGVELVLCSGDAHGAYAVTGPTRWSAISAVVEALDAASAAPVLVRLLTEDATS